MKGRDMEFLHTEFRGGPERMVLVTLDRQANVMLLDDVSFDAYRTGRGFRYYGGWASRSPVRLRTPRNGDWHVVVDLGGGSGTIRASVRILGPGAQATLF